MTTRKPLHTFHIPLWDLLIRHGSRRVWNFVRISTMDDQNLNEKPLVVAIYLPYQEITKNMITAQNALLILNLVDKIVKEKFENFKTELSESKQL
jgi:hypothetical protein